MQYPGHLVFPKQQPQNLETSHHWLRYSTHLTVIQVVVIKAHVNGFLSTSKVHINGVLSTRKACIDGVLSTELITHCNVYLLIIKQFFQIR